VRPWSAPPLNPMECGNSNGLFTPRRRPPPPPRMLSQGRTVTTRVTVFQNPPVSRRGETACPGHVRDIRPWPRRSPQRFNKAGSNVSAASIAVTVTKMRSPSAIGTQRPRPRGCARSIFLPGTCAACQAPDGFWSGWGKSKPAWQRS
jgi:hypothetical protein